MELYTPTEYTGSLMELCQQRRGEFKEVKYLTAQRNALVYELPLAEVITDFFDEMKSRTKGYASMEYQQIGSVQNGNLTIVQSQRSNIVQSFGRD
jgi:GTP-binding protein LepA